MTAVIAVDRMKRKQSILVVDDEQDITFVLKMQLSDNYDVNTYTDPAEALANFKPFMYDLVLFDYLMPKMNGFEFYRAIKQTDPGVNTCMMTAYEAIPSYGRGTDAAMPFDSKFVLKKPFDSDQMFAKLREIMKSRNRKP